MDSLSCDKMKKISLKLLIVDQSENYTHTLLTFIMIVFSYVIIHLGISNEREINVTTFKNRNIVLLCQRNDERSAINLTPGVTVLFVLNSR